MNTADFGAMLLIKPPCLPAVAANAAYIGLFDQGGDIVGDCLPDTAVAASGNQAAFNNIPQSNAVPKCKLTSVFVGSRRVFIKQACKQGPEAVLRVTVIKAGLPRTNRRESSQNEDA